MSNSENNKDVSVLNWAISLVLLAIPFVNFILLLVWAFGGSRYPSKKPLPKPRFCSG